MPTTAPAQPLLDLTGWIAGAMTDKILVFAVEEFEAYRGRSPSFIRLRVDQAEEIAQDRTDHIRAYIKEYRHKGPITEWRGIRIDRI